MNHANHFRGPPRVFTDNIFEDIGRYYFPNETTTQQVKQVVNSRDGQLKHKLYVVTERLEFVDHLLALRELLIKDKKEPEEGNVHTVDGILVIDIFDKIEFCGREFDGVDYDIEAACFYLLLTCIETIVSNNEHIEMSQWLIDNWDDYYKTNMDPKHCIAHLKDRYYDEYGLRRNFRNALIRDISDNLRLKLSEQFAVVKLNNNQIDKKSWQNWEGKNIEQKISSLASYLYDKVRCKYTHESHRSFLPSTPVRLLLASKDNVLISLVHVAELSLLDYLRETIIELTKQNLLGIK